MSKLYKIKYDITPGAFSKEELKASGLGGCDQVLVCSVIDNPDGSGSYAWISKNGHTQGEMKAYKKLQCLSILAKELSEDEELGPGAREFCETIFGAYKYAVLNSRDQK